MLSVNADLILQAIMMFLGVMVTAFFGYLGIVRMAKSNMINMASKADKELVEELRTEIKELRTKVNDLQAELKIAVATKEQFQAENLELMRRYIKISNGEKHSN